MGCGNPSAEEKLLLTKLERLEIQVQKEKELKKLAEIEGKDFTNTNIIQGGQPKILGISKENKKVKNKKVKLPPIKGKQEKDDPVKIFKSKDKGKESKKKGETKTEAKSKKSMRKRNLSKPKLEKKAASEDSKDRKKKKK